MFTIKTTENNLGVIISGDFNDINELYTAMGNLVGYEGQIKNYEGVSLRILGICYDLRHAFMGDREIQMVHSGINDEIKKWHGKLYPDYNLYYSVNILWIEAVFSVLALEDLINIATDKKLSKKYINEVEPFFHSDDEEENKKIEERIKNEKEIRLPYDIAIIRMYKEAVWVALSEVVGINRYRRLKKAANEENNYYYKTLRYVGFCTQYLDVLNSKYIDTRPEKRDTLLASSIRKLIKLDSEYYDIESDIKNYAMKNDISYLDVRLDVDYPEEVEW